MFPFDLPTIVGRLRGNIENLYAMNTQLIMVTKDLGGAIQELSKGLSVAQFCGLEGLDSSEHGPAVRLPETPHKEDFDLFQLLTIQESLELLNLECSRQQIVRLWRLVEEQKAGIIKTARERKND